MWLYGGASKIGKMGKTTTGNQTSVDNLANLSASFPNPSWRLKLSEVTSDKTRDFFCPEPSPVSKYSSGQSHCVAAAAADPHRSRAANDVCLCKAAPLSLWIKFDILTFYLHEHLDPYSC